MSASTTITENGANALKKENDGLIEVWLKSALLQLTYPSKIWGQILACLLQVSGNASANGMNPSFNPLDA